MAVAVQFYCYIVQTINIIYHYIIHVSCPCDCLRECAYEVNRFSLGEYCPNVVYGMCKKTLLVHISILVQPMHKSVNYAVNCFFFETIKLC
jgi:hypothetical protein